MEDVAPRADPLRFDWDHERERRLELRRVRLVSRRLHGLARRLLWEVVLIERVEEALAVERAIGRDPSLASAPRVLLVWTGRLFGRIWLEKAQSPGDGQTRGSVALVVDLGNAIKDATTALRLEFASLLPRLSSLQTVSTTNVDVLGYDRPLFGTSVLKLELGHARTFEVAFLARSHPSLRRVVVGQVLADESARPVAGIVLNGLTHLAFGNVLDFGFAQLNTPSLEVLDVEGACRGAVAPTIARKPVPAGAALGSVTLRRPKVLNTVLQLLPSTLRRLSVDSGLHDMYYTGDVCPS